MKTNFTEIYINRQNFKKHLLFQAVYGIISFACEMQAGTVQCSSVRTFGIQKKKEKSQMTKLEAFANEQLREDVPQFNIGDTVKVHNLIREGTRERIQMYEGTVIAKHGGGISETFTVRRVAYGCGVEKTFPLHSPHVQKVDVIRVGKVRRSKLYYIRDRVGKAAKVKEQLQ